MTPAEQKSMTVVHVRGDEATAVPGRRSFIQYLSLGASEASQGRLRAEILVARPESKEPTGWHYHECDVQFLHVLDGSIDIQFADGDWIELAAGDSISIPGGTPHQERGGSGTCRVMEISVPAAMGTVSITSPASRA
jgi:quercetin dioxygenase-like cupin family protein